METTTNSFYSVNINVVLTRSIFALFLGQCFEGVCRFHSESSQAGNYLFVIKVG